LPQQRSNIDLAVAGYQLLAMSGIDLTEEIKDVTS